MITTVPAIHWPAVRAGLSRGWIETRQSFTETANVVGHLLPPAAYIAVLLMLRGKTAPGTGVSMGALVLPGFVSISIIFGGLWGPTGVITADREDGTLLRAKATPHGMIGYLVGKIVMFALTTLFSLVVVLVPGLLLVSDLVFDLRALMLLSLIFVVGMVATVPIGVALGSLMKSSVQAMLVPLVCMLLVFVSGIFYPIDILPAWLRSLAQALPIYWVGLGVRAALLPADVVAAEVGGAWSAMGSLAALGVWSAIGLLLAPILLRRMARRQSGSAMARVRERIMSKGY